MCGMAIFDCYALVFAEKTSWRETWQRMVVLASEPKNCAGSMTFPLGDHVDRLMKGALGWHGRYG